jgi:outer membrane protein assembly factor BamB
MSDTSKTIDSSPAVDVDGNIYTSSGNNSISAFDKEGIFKWRTPTNGAIKSSSIAIGGIGTLYVGSSDGSLYAIGSVNATIPVKILRLVRIHIRLQRQF